MNPERRNCIHLIQSERPCLVLKTPTNETIHLLCKDSEEELFSYQLRDELNNCFNISRPDQSYKEVCQKKFDDYSVGVTTPDNFTVLFHSEFCSSSVSNEEKLKYNYFTNTFSFDPETKRCYKIYNEQQDVSPYTCLSEEVFRGCVEELPRVKDCEGIITQNDETVVLHCRSEERDTQNQNCFKVLTAGGNSHIACLERVEERCVGIKTPSNLTVLLECYFCAKSGL